MGSRCCTTQRSAMTNRTTLTPSKTRMVRRLPRAPMTFSVGLLPARRASKGLVTPGGFELLVLDPRRDEAEICVPVTASLRPLRWGEESAERFPVDGIQAVEDVLGRDGGLREELWREVLEDFAGCPRVDADPSADAVGDIAVHRRSVVGHLRRGHPVGTGLRQQDSFEIRAPRFDDALVGGGELGHEGRGPALSLRRSNDPDECRPLSD